MLSFITRNKIHINTKIRDYCIQSTNDSIRRITEKYNEDKKIQKISIINPFTISASNPSDPESNIGMILSIVFFLSSSTYIYYFCKDSVLKLFSFTKYIDVSKE